MWERAWLEQYPLVHFEVGERLITIGETYDYYYYLEDGICARVSPTVEGEDVVLLYYQAGEMIGLYLEEFGKEAISEFVARKPCQCRQIPWREVEQYVKTHPHLCYRLMKALVHECDFWATSYIAYSLGGGISVLSLVLSTQARQQENGQWLVDPMFTNMELSHYCGIHTVSISRLMTRLHKEGVLTRCKDGIVIEDMARLKNYVKLGDA
ncbi:MAG: Crp/Fnr family transcriptional regulator [Peptococcaceae bacterium]